MKSKKKTFAFLSLLVALAMMCTLVLTACDKGKDDDKDKDEGGTTEVGEALALVTDDTLKDKFVALYTFEGETAAVGGTVAAYDPYTGKAVSALNGVYTAAQTAEGVASKDAAKSKTTLHEGSAFEIYTLGDTDFFPGELVEETDDEGELTAQYIKDGSGISYSFWYNGASQSDWNKIVASSAAPEVNYGNISFTGATAYPSMGATVGRAAYTAESYKAAQDAGLTPSQLAKFSGTYNVYNAMCGEGAAEITGDMSIVDKAVATMGNEISNKWVYFTVVVEEDAISFYRNGILAYTYDANVSASVGTGVKEIYTNLYMDIVASLGAGSGMKFFGEGTSSIDDLLIGKELTYDEVTALYENMSGATVSDEDKELKSTVSSSTVNTYSKTVIQGSWWELEKYYANTKLANSVTSIEYTAKLYYTAPGSGWGLPAFILVDSAEVSATTPAAGSSSGLLYITGAAGSDLSEDIKEAEAATDTNGAPIKTGDGTSFAPNLTVLTALKEDPMVAGFGDILYTKTGEEDGVEVVTNICEVLAKDLTVTIARDTETNIWTVTYYIGEKTDENVVLKYTVEFSIDSADGFYIYFGGEYCAMEDLSVKVDGAAATVSKTTTGNGFVDAKTDGFTPAA